MLASNISGHCKDIHKQKCRALHDCERPPKPRYSNWQALVNDLAFVMPISFPPFMIEAQKLMFDVVDQPCKTQPPSEMDVDEIFFTKPAKANTDGSQRSVSPRPLEIVNIHKQPIDDLCGNPTCYFKDGVMDHQERKQVKAMSHHCAQFKVFQRALLLKKRKYQRQVHNLKASEHNLRKQMYHHSDKMKKAQFEAAHLEPLKKQLHKALAENSGLKIENQRLRDKHMQELEDNCGQII